MKTTVVVISLAVLASSMNATSTTPEEMQSLQEAAPSEIEQYENCIRVEYADLAQSGREAHNALLAQAVAACEMEKANLLAAYSEEEQPIVDSLIAQTIAKFVQ